MLHLINAVRHTHHTLPTLHTHHTLRTLHTHHTTHRYVFPLVECLAAVARNVGMGSVDFAESLWSHSLSCMAMVLQDEKHWIASGKDGSTPEPDPEFAIIALGNPDVCVCACVCVCHTSLSTTHSLLCSYYITHTHKMHDFSSLYICFSRTLHTYTHTLDLCSGLCDGLGQHVSELVRRTIDNTEGMNTHTRTHCCTLPHTHISHTFIRIHAYTHIHTQSHTHTHRHRPHLYAGAFLHLARWGHTPERSRGAWYGSVCVCVCADAFFL
jgi:hypothetical protein